MGQLNKHIFANLNVGDGRVNIDGKSVRLSAAPTVIDGRLYLPAELLQLVNGIPVRWEPKTKLLWVTTQGMRRD